MNADRSHLCGYTYKMSEQNTGTSEYTSDHYQPSVGQLQVPSDLVVWYRLSEHWMPPLKGNVVQLQYGSQLNRELYSSGHPNPVIRQNTQVFALILKSKVSMKCKSLFPYLRVRTHTRI